MSKEEVTQGDPLALALYNITLPRRPLTMVRRQRCHVGAAGKGGGMLHAPGQDCTNICELAGAGEVLCDLSTGNGGEGEGIICSEEPGDESLSRLLLCWRLQQITGNAGHVG